MTPPPEQPVIAETPAPAADALRSFAPSKAEGLPRRDAIALTLIMLTHGVGQTLIFAILPAVARDLGIADQAVSLIYVLPAIAWSFMTTWWGRHSDRRGRRIVILTGIVGFMLSQLMFAGAALLGYAGWIGAGTLWALILLSRLVYSGLSSGSLPASQAYIVSRVSPAERATALGRLTASWNLGNLLGPAVIGLLTALGVLTPLFATAALALVIWAWVRGCLRSEGPVAGATPAGRLSPLDARLRSSMLIALCGSFAQASLLQTLGFYLMDHLGVATAEVPRAVGFALMFSAISTLLAQTVFVQSLRPMPRTLEILGAGINAVAFLGLILADRLFVIWIATALCGFGYGLLRLGNVAGASHAVRGDEQGAVAGLNSAMWSAGYIIAPLAAMSLHQIDPRLPYIAAMLGTALALTAAKGRKEALAQA